MAEKDVPEKGITDYDEGYDAGYEEGCKAWLQADRKGTIQSYAYQVALEASRKAMTGSDVHVVFNKTFDEVYKHLEEAI
jgi:hypothetical protein